MPSTRRAAIHTVCQAPATQLAGSATSRARNRPAEPTLEEGAALKIVPAGQIRLRRRPQAYQASRVEIGVPIASAAERRPMQPHPHAQGGDRNYPEGRHNQRSTVQHAPIVARRGFQRDDAPGRARRLHGASQKTGAAWPSSGALATRKTYSATAPARGHTQKQRDQGCRLHQQDRRAGASAGRRKVKATGTTTARRNTVPIPVP